MKTTVGRLLTGVVALALLLGGFGLMQDTAQAQSVSPTRICSNDNAGCSIVKFGDHDADDDNPSPTAHQYYEGTAATGNSGVGVTALLADDYNNVFEFTHTANGELKVQNLDLPTVVSRNDGPDGTADTTDDFDNPDANPKTIDFTSGTPITFVAVHRSAGLMDQITSDTYQVKGFNGNTIQVSFTPTTGGTFAVIKTVMVDNGRPILVSTSPEAGPHRQGRRGHHLQRRHDGRRRRLRRQVRERQE